MPRHERKGEGRGGGRGFAGMDEERQREIASKGGKAAHEKGTAHEFDSEEARAAGRKGGLAAHDEGRGEAGDSSGGGTSSGGGGGGSQTRGKGRQGGRGGR